MAKTKNAGTITVEIELEKGLSRSRRIAVEMKWDDMLSLPISRDLLQIDRTEIELLNGPASDEVILDRPNSLPHFTWQGIYRNKEWMSLNDFARILQKDRRVLVTKELQ